MFRRGTKRPRFIVGGHSIFEHDDSSNHSGTGMTDYDEDSLSQQHTTLNNSFDHHPDRPRRVQRPPSKPVQQDNTNLNACLDHLLRIVSRKDKEGFFQYPVTDQVTRIGLLSSRRSLFLVCSRLFSDHHSTDGLLHDEEEDQSG